MDKKWWVTDYTVTIMLNKFINIIIYMFASSPNCCSIMGTMP